MTVDNILWENWGNWSHGGLSKADLDERIRRKEYKTILEWYEASHERCGTQITVPDVKTLVDLATWCTLGSHPLPYWPYSRRKAELERQATRYGVSVPVLIDLIAEAEKLLEAINTV